VKTWSVVALRERESNDLGATNQADEDTTMPRDRENTREIKTEEKEKR